MTTKLSLNQKLLAKEGKILPNDVTLATNEKVFKNMLVRICPICQKNFVTTKAKSFIYCSIECAERRGVNFGNKE